MAANDDKPHEQTPPLDPRERSILDWSRAIVACHRATIAAQACGPDTGTAVLLLGGATWSRDWWTDQFCADLISAGTLAGVPLRLISFDPRDTGESTQWPPGAPGYTSGDLARDALAVLDHFDVSEAFIVGFSMGGGLAQRIAAQHPDRVRGLVLMSTSPAGNGTRALPGPSKQIAASFATPPADPDFGDHDSTLQWVLEVERPYAGPGMFDEAYLRECAEAAFHRTPSLEPAATNHGLVAFESSGLGVRDFSVPSLVIHGSADPLFPLPHGEALAHLLDADLLVLPGVGHQFPPAVTWPKVTSAMASLVARTS